MIEVFIPYSNRNMFEDDSWIRIKEVDMWLEENVGNIYHLSVEPKISYDDLDKRLTLIKSILKNDDWKWFYLWNCDGEYIYFSSKEDATLFKLTWG